MEEARRELRQWNVVACEGASVWRAGKMARKGHVVMRDWRSCGGRFLFRDVLIGLGLLRP